tara:strand:+ start:30 stop:704 length:675 start_codon:yes stop_codon:yes gene_type:complete
MKCSGEYSRLMKDVRVVTIGNTKQIAWSIKLQYDIFHLFSTRYRLHKTVYNHPKVKAYEYIIIEILQMLKKSMVGKKTQSYDISKTTDSIIYCEIVKKLRQKLYTRQHPKFIGEFLFTNPQTLKKKEIITNMLTKMNKETPKLIYQELEIGFAGSKSENPLKNIYYYNDESDRFGFKIKPEMHSFIIPINFNEKLIRIYCLNRNKESVDEAYIKYTQVSQLYNS